MARPEKSGLDYFPVDVDIISERKLRKVKMKYGYLGFCVYFSLLTLIYKDKGYYLDYSDKDIVVWDILDHLQGKYQPYAETIADVIEDLVACGLFSGDHFNSKILTSKRVQETYYKATVDRKSIDIDDKIWMLSVDEMTNLSVRSVILQKFINQPNNVVNRPNNEVNITNNSESKVNKSITTTTARAREETEIPDIEDVRRYFSDNHIDADAEQFYLYNQSKNPSFKDWRLYASAWGKIEKHKNVRTSSKAGKTNQKIGFDLDEFFNAATLKTETGGIP